ncbi:hypothetical protein GCM10009785_09740 [Brooklawnia cerclae]|uniref:Uncharacterized protein n=1 Tax=Brooklawnia cerclae TaxID=349934 RepID=A0ABX0SI72_9ACTN|nr:hypothetical protein [Brooklawnia cerclae]NIH58098.1 hypothetical protein [Brooklawnia cerclae]
MRKRIGIVLAVIALVLGLMALRNRARAQASAELWAAATDDLD